MPNSSNRVEPNYCSFEGRKKNAVRKKNSQITSFDDHFDWNRDRNLTREIVDSSRRPRRSKMQKSTVYCVSTSDKESETSNFNCFALHHASLRLENLIRAAVGDADTTTPFADLNVDGLI